MDGPKSRGKLTQRLTFTIRKNDDRSKRYCRVLLYGNPGTGKTRAIGQVALVPDLQPILFIDVDGGSSTVQDADNIDWVHDIYTFGQLIELSRALIRGELEYKTICIDGLGALYRQQLNVQMGQSANAGSDVGIARWQPGVPAQQDYQLAHNRCTSALDLLKSVPANVFVATGSSEFKDATNRVHKRADLPGQMAERIFEYFDYVGYLYNRVLGKEVQHIAQFVEYGGVFAKERSPKDGGILGAALNVSDQNVAQLIWKAYMTGIKPAELTTTLNRDDQIAGDASPTAVN